MTFQEAEKKLTGIYITAYGFTEGQKKAKVLAPNILTDFRKMLRAAELGTEVRENYQSEDRLTEIELVGMHQDTGLVILDVKNIRA